MITNNKHFINAIKLPGHLLVLHGIYVTICWTSDDCDGQVDLKLHLSVGQVILFPYLTTDVCGSCDLASKLNYVTVSRGELDIDVSFVLFRKQTILRWCRVVCVAILHVIW